MVLEQIKRYEINFCYEQVTGITILLYTISYAESITEINYFAIILLLY
jgi:hypothetical protein